LAGRAIYQKLTSKTNKLENYVPLARGEVFWPAKHGFPLAAFFVIKNAEKSGFFILKGKNSLFPKMRFSLL